MLKLVDIKKDYVMSDETVHALKGVSVNFRRNEFVAILGQSGCGKTTLLNIVGGLDRYSSGDLIIEGKSTKSYKDGDWDTYRNHSIGFIFQSYNLIPHINILKNVELALTISGISKKDRKQRAEKALEMVGLKGQGRKKPNQLSGGQMQRVAIARALINNPEIVLADEPTGALDSETSIQIMDLLQEVAKDRLVVMVTHNPDLAKKYATRIINMKDGELIHDSNPYEGETKQELEEIKAKRQDISLSKGAKKQSSMSFWTALNLSFTNLMTKKGRTFLISFAGSIGIIGIAMILSLSYGFSNYINEVQLNSMSTYPLQIRKTSASSSMMEMMGGGSGSKHELDKFPEEEEFHENSMMTDMISQFISIDKNDTRSFKEYLEKPEVAAKFSEVTTDIQYEYGQSLNIFATQDYDGKPLNRVRRLSPLYYSSNIQYGDTYVYQGDTYRRKSTDPMPPELEEFYKNDPRAYRAAAGSVQYAINWVDGNPFSTLLNNEELLNEQYDVLMGHFPEKVNEIVVKLNQFNEISDLFLYGMGVKDISYMMSQYVYSILNSSDDDEISIIGKAMPKPADDPSYSGTFEDLMNLEFSVLTRSQTFEKVGENHYQSIEHDQEKMMNLINNGFKLKVVGIVRPKKGANVTSISGAIGYHPDLYKTLNELSLNPPKDSPLYSDALKVQLDNPNINIMTGLPFENVETHSKEYEDNLFKLGYIDLKDPDAIYLYPKSFDDKVKIQNYIEEYNQMVRQDMEADKVVKLIDNVGAMLDSVRIIVDSVTYVLIAFVSISLLVSSIMIGIITYVSVLERTKEIGVLRSIGARKKDISRVFNAETLIVGLMAGLIGVGVASLLNIPIMLIINALTEIGLLVIVPWYGFVFLPAISITMTIIAGLIPSSIASKRDPVIALRTE